MQEGLRRPLSRDRQSQSTTENWFERRQRSAITDSRGLSRPKGLVPGSFQHLGGSRSLQNDTTQKGGTSEHTRKPSRQKFEPNNKRGNNRKSSDAARGGYKGARPAEKSEARPKSEDMKRCQFEVKLSDFPELCDTKPLASPDVRSCWGSVRVSVLYDSPAATVKETSGNKGPKQKSKDHVISTEKTQQKSSATTGADIELVLPNRYGSPATSWASVASQPPKDMQKSPAAQDTSSQEDLCLPEAEQTSKKKRKKKKKSKPGSEDLEQETHNMALKQQEPPKFEDEEEFPDLSLASVNPSKAQRHLSIPGIQENTGTPEKDGSVLQSENINKSKAADVKSGSATLKKVQPVGQKKSKALVQLDLGNMLAVLEQKQSQKSRQDVKPLTLSVGGALPIVHKDPTAQKKHSWQQERIAHNPLDSTCPLVKKGKQREVPKAKKPTPLKRVILKEREERKQNRLLEERDPTKITSEVGQEPEASENLSESSSVQQSHEATSDQSVAEEDDQTGSSEDLRNLVEENVQSKNVDSNSNPNRPKIHSRKFRDYCSQMLSKDVDECVTTLLKELARFQDRLYQKDPMKARMKRRLVMGLREVLKHLKLRKVKCVIISPNCERVQSKGGLDEALHTIIDTCREQGVPFVFALSRKSLGRCVNKAVPVSLVGIFNYDGAQDYYHKMIELTSQARKAYEVMITNLEVNCQEQLGEENEAQQHMEPPLDTPEAEEPEYT
ncbi:selenocysteine insertion sequence-binding protein 2-like isoform X2 [Hemibagrus wyckioides]|uniref:selenocysteine insertion sequence-binding protein 2-like isoform X2 n=1 Tax=Hemibagrus wyckioides TaxID=337641 RepID=UPI00266C2A63|nr:selenocysteine insertion sequence-binding protein 2-like isoform X2 [Hemibagrus wyckioides]